MARNSPATPGYFPASASTSPISTSAGTTPGHSCCAQKPMALPEQPRGMERIAGDQLLHVLALAQIRSDDDPLGGAIGMQQEQLERITKVIMVQLVVADTVKPHRRALCH